MASSSRPPPASLHRKTIAGFLLWTFCILFFLYWNVRAENRQVLELARIKAETIINKDRSFRRWAASHGGVYVRPSEKTPPNPYLTLADRDLTTADGRKLTLMNPSYILRQVMEGYGDQFGARGHITSLHPINPDNAPDSWEREALDSLARGASSASTVVDRDGAPVLRLMLPMVMEAPCMKCHFGDGVPVGGLRGGVSTSVPIGNYMESARGSNFTFMISFLAVWLAGGMVMAFVWRRGLREEQARHAAEQALREHQQRLEQLVDERTSQYRQEAAERRLVEGKLRRSHGELERAYEDLKASQCLLAQNEKMACIGTLAAGVAHEINNPTGFILSNLGILRKYGSRIREFLSLRPVADGSVPFEEDLAAARERLKIDFVVEDMEGLIVESLEGAERISHIVKDMKNFSRASEGHAQLVDINQGIESTLNVVWNELKYKAIITKDLSPLPLTRCNLGQINQVFLNLLVNASQAIADHGEITIRSYSENGHIFVSIRDSGVGIPPEVQSRMFEPFFTTKEPGKGTGLGLSISYDLVRKHGGEITVESAPGKGSIFTVRIPVVH